MLEHGETGEKMQVVSKVTIASCAIVDVETHDHDHTMRAQGRTLQKYRLMPSTASFLADLQIDSNENEPIE